MTWLGILLLGAGVGLVYAAVTNQHPVTEFSAALGGRGGARPSSAMGTTPGRASPIPNAQAPSVNGQLA